MLTLLGDILDMSTLTPHGACLLWEPGLIWLNAISDALVAAAFFATAFLLAYFVLRRRRHMLFMFRCVFWGYAIFIAICGVTRLLSILTLWVPVYGVEGATKGFLALISLGVTAGLLMLLPRILVMPTRIQLQQAYAALEEEVRQRCNAEAMVRRFQEIEATESQVRQAQKMEAVGQLTGGVAHDFNNILTVITGTIEILADAVAKEPELAAITKMIDEAAGRGAELTQHLLAFARKQPLQPREIDINSLIIDTAKLLRPTLGEQIQIESVFEDESCVAIVDPNQLTTAILNLALNARDAMPGGGKLIVETGAAYLDEVYASANDVPPGHYVLIAVSDTGSGIPANMLARVFDPFFTSKGPGKGTGLGLSMVYGFIKQSAGHIKIYSEEGHGTTIKMYLPPGKTPTAVSEGVTPASIEGGHETILVVEDDRLVRDYVLAQLHSLGYVTLQAANAAEALVIVGSGQPFDLLFTDVIMPGKMNGRQLADEVLKTRADLRVVYTSGYTENAIIHHGRLDSGVLLLAKPYRKSDLARIIRKALGG